MFVTFLGSFSVWLLKDEYYGALSYLIGGLLIWYGLISWGIGMSFIFQKKYIALSMGIIVFKYAILGVIIYWFVHQNWAQPLWFSLGVASFVITALIYALTEALKEEKKDVI